MCYPDTKWAPRAFRAGVPCASARAGQEDFKEEVLYCQQQPADGAAETDPVGADDAYSDSTGSPMSQGCAART